MILNQWLILFLAAILSFVLTYITILIYRHNNWLDDPKKNNQLKVIHKTPVPRGGGIPIFFTILILGLLLLPLDKHLWGILLGALILMIIGIIDDLKDLKPQPRLVLGVLAAMIVVGVGIGIPYISNPFGMGVIYLNQPQIAFTFFSKMHTIWVIADIFAILWIVGLMNFVNWSKGLDGQLPGIVVVAAITILLLSQKFSADITQWSVTILAAILAGAYLGFLPWNIFPQKIMPGYGGGSLAGYFLAILAILSTTKVGTLIVVLGVPIVDAVLVVIRRILAGKSPWWGDTRHLHHSLLALGWSKSKVAVFYWLITAIFGVIALNLNSQQKLYTIVLIVLAFLTFLVWLKRSKPSSKLPGQDSG